MKKSIQTILSKEISKSQKMIELYSQDLSIKEIAELMNTRYNFVYNVVSNFCNMNKIKLTTKTKETNKKDVILEMYLNNKSMKEISIDLKTNYNYVHKVISEFKKSNERIESDVQVESN